MAQRYLLLLTLLIGACATATSTKEADDALARGDYDTADSLYRQVLAEREVDPLTRERADLAARRAAEERSGGTSTGPSGYSEFADRWNTEGERLLAEGLPAPAFDAFRRADAFGRQANRAGMERARKLSAEEVIADAVELEKAGREGRAIATIAAGLERFGGDPDLVEADLRLRREVARRLLVLATSEQQAERYGTATVLTTAARTLDPEATAPAGLANAVDSILTLRLELSFSDDTGGRVDPDDFAMAVARAIDASQASPYVRTSGSLGERVAARGSLSTLTVARPTPRTEMQTRTYPLGIETIENPDRRRAEREYERLAQVFSNAEWIWEATRDEVDEFESLAASGRAGGNSGRRAGVYAQTVYLRGLGNIRAREVKARSIRDDIGSALDDAREQLDRTPQMIDIERYGEVTQEVRLAEMTARATARFWREADGAKVGGSEESATVTHHAEDLSAPAVPEARAPADPDELPDDVTFAEEALAALAREVAHGLIEQVAELRRPLLMKARKLDKEGDAAAALDHYALFVLAAGEQLKLERAVAARKLRSRFGIRIDDGEFDLKELGLPR